MTADPAECESDALGNTFWKWGIDLGYGDSYDTEGQLLYGNSG